MYVMLIYNVDIENDTASDEPREGQETGEPGRTRHTGVSGNRAALMMAEHEAETPQEEL